MRAEAKGLREVRLTCKSDATVAWPHFLSC